MADDLISRSALLKEFEKRQKAAVDGVFADCFLSDAQNLSTEWWMVEDIVEAAPTIDAQPVRHGRWVEHLSFTAFGEYNGSSYECSNCHSSSYDDAFEHFHYCPNCGAKMDGGAENG